MQISLEPITVFLIERLITPAELLVFMLSNKTPIVFIFKGVADSVHG